MSTASTPLGDFRTSHGRRSAVLAAVTLIAIAIAIAVAVQQDVFPGSSTVNGVQGSGVAATQTRVLPSFTSIDLAGANDVLISVGGKQSVKVSGDDNLIGRVTTRVREGRLHIGSTGSFTTKSPMSVQITVPSLSALALSGSGNVWAENVDSRRLTVWLSGTGLMRISGTVTRLDIDLAGTGNAGLQELVAGTVVARVGGSGQIVVNATKTLDASVPGTGSIVYFGNPPAVKTSITGTGAVLPG